ncbi:MAG: hypothetical protein AAF363_07550 [Bacteroidota bacterium]
MLKHITFRKIFSIDALGALITFIMLSLVLARYESVFGMPEDMLNVLAGVAAGFAFYSSACFFLVKSNWLPYLMVIATANCLYSLTTLVLVIHFYQSLTVLGIAYFMGEIILVVSLAVLEFRMCRKNGIK